MEKKYSFRNSKPVVMELFGKPVGWFDCISDVGRKFGHSTTTITMRIKRNAEINGVRIRYPLEEEDLNTMECLSPPKKYGAIPRAKKGVVVDGNGELVKSKPKPKTDPKSTPKNEEKPLDREKYNIIPYEIRNGIECITPCPFLPFPKPMVGSARCIECSSFKGKDKNTHEVACKGKFIYEKKV